MSNEPVDVLIIGAGASGAAVAWSLADTRMRILCLEQGDWVNSANYPSAGPGYETRQDFAIRPNDRRLDIPVTDNNTTSIMGTTDNGPLNILIILPIGSKIIIESMTAQHYLFPKN